MPEYDDALCDTCGEFTCHSPDCGLGDNWAPEHAGVYNRFEAEARAAKVFALVNTIDEITLGAEPGFVHIFVSSLSSAAWISLAHVAAINVPSDTTRALVIEHYARLAAP